MQGQSAPAPIRGSTKKGAEENGEDAEEQEDDGGAGAVDVMDLLPRSDIRYQTHTDRLSFQSVFALSQP